MKQPRQPRFHKRYKPKLSAYENTHSATQATFQAMEQACVEAIVERKLSVEFTFPYFAKFPKGFPPKIIASENSSTITYRIKARKLLEWLNKEGHSTQTPKSVVESSTAFIIQLRKLERSFEAFDKDI